MTNKSNLAVIKFNGTPIPTPYENYDAKDTNYVLYGSDNNYPNYLLKLYNESPIHAAIVNAKANYVIGDGFKRKDGSEIYAKVNGVENIEDFVSKVVKDYLLFNCFCVEVVYNSFNVPIEYHFIPAQKIRPNKSKTKFWYSDDFTNKSKTIAFERWKQTPTDSTSKIFYFQGYSPSVSNVYSVPEYSGCIKAIQTDIEIREFNLNNIKNHFSVSTLITFFRGSNVSDEVKKEIISELKASYTGASGKKMIVDFQDPGQPSADVKNISPNEWDKAYQAVGQKVLDDIMQGHEVTSPMLFGVKTEGQLGGATELETAYEIFKNTYVRNKRAALESALNLLFTGSELSREELVFYDKQLFQARLSENLKQQVYTINELRAEAGLQALPTGNRLLNETAPEPKQFSGQSIHLNDEDYEKIKDMGVVVDEFDFVEDGEFITTKEDFNKIELKFETGQEIADYLLKNDVTGKSIKEIKVAIRKELGTILSENELRTTIDSLNKAGVLDVTVDGDTVKEVKPKESKREVQVMYKYEVREGLGAPIINTTRPFCRRVIENNKLYSKADIQSMAAIFGYDIFKYGGGFYHNPQTGETTSHCRHQFKSRTVVRKK